MRKLNPLKAISHTLKSVFLYRLAAIRYGLFWIPLLFLLGLFELFVGLPTPEEPKLGLPEVLQLLSAGIGLVGFCSMAVSWHRFILRDEAGTPARLDPQVWSYLGNSLLIMLAVVMPVGLLVVLLAFLPPIFTLLIIPAAIAAGAVAMRLSIKLPAVALGRTDFTFGNAWAASEGNFWQIVGVFALNAAIVLGLGLAFMGLLELINLIAPPAVPFVALVAGAGFQLFYTMFNAGIFTALYGFFVERRDY